jgi:hypothetical protein
MEKRYSLALAGKYADADLAPPASGPSVYRRLGRTIAERHGLDPLCDPEAIAKAEGLHVAWNWSPGRHGLHYGNTVICSPVLDTRERGLVLNHERAHYWYRQLGTPTHTESDVILLTVELAFPSWLRDREPEFCPRWLVDLCRKRDSR